MIFYDRIENSIEFIENNLDKNLSLEDVARASNFSLSHFYKIFLSMTGFTVREYIRNRRLSKAANELINTRKSIIDIAIEAGFNSHEVFTRAFNQLYGVSPTKYRSDGKELITFKKYELFGKEIEDKYSKIRDSIKVSVKILNSDEIILIGMEMYTSVQDTIEKNTIASFWHNMFIPKIIQIKNIKQPYVSIGYEIHNPETDKLYHMACVEVSSKNIPDGMICKIIPPTKFVVFSSDKVLSPIEYSTLIQYIYGEWLPMSGHKLSSDFTMDMGYSSAYYSDYYYAHDLRINSKLEVYIPIS
ncbi:MULTISPECIES: AraC family transcriptional regulator [Clostridium]|uniref:AraC family transcriptional regulator n=1 Tax=Clostridium TaxID=1485 RepID=UPI0008248ABD|nr:MULTISPECIES: helix-turn-helix domain-containing protein [Clostridium]PJI08219.1 AraC family transcriptional regulator [Clostridium sp. CT7]